MISASVSGRAHSLVQNVRYPLDMKKSTSSPKEHCLEDTNFPYVAGTYELVVHIAWAYSCYFLLLRCSKGAL